MVAMVIGTWKMVEMAMLHLLRPLVQTQRISGI